VDCFRWTQLKFAPGRAKSEGLLQAEKCVQFAPKFAKLTTLVTQQTANSACPPVQTRALSMLVSRRSVLPQLASLAALPPLLPATAVATEESAAGVESRPPVPDRLVVLTFDDSAKSHFTIARPILKDYGFGATFFITEGFDFRTNQRDYMTWDEIRQLHEEGFEVGNHTRDHLGITTDTLDRLPEQLNGIAERCEHHGIPRPVTFAWPGNAWTPAAFSVLKQQGIIFARRGGSPEFAYEQGRGVAVQPGADHPLLLPSAGDARPAWSLENFIQAVRQAKSGRPAILQYHGVPDTAHAWVSSNEDTFRACMKYLQLEKYTVITLRDLRKWVDPQVWPADPELVIQQRRRRLEAGEPI
jgi:peptidoglycan/xylan/chitin deacetylase (PgdA/CDA1 family)